MPSESTAPEDIVRLTAEQERVEAHNAAFQQLKTAELVLTDYFEHGTSLS